MNLDRIFPFDEYRPYQKETLKKSINAFKNGKDVVIIEAPVGFGKSPVNIALSRWAGSSFYCSPQRKLVNQVSEDFGPDELAIDGGSSDVMPLLGRSAYKCRVSGVKSDVCPVRDSKKESCTNKGGCVYWRQKRAALGSPTALITFAMLVTDSRLRGLIPPNYLFNDRDILIVDEGHSLESQTASMFCGFKVSPYNLPDKVWDKIEDDMPEGEIEDYLQWLTKVAGGCKKFFKTIKGTEKERMKCRNMVKRISYMFEEFESGRDWIVNEGEVSYFNEKVRRPEFKPIKVDRFLKKNVWCRADKIVLSSATIPFRNNPRKWLDRIGLGDKSYHFITVPMNFPVENRPIITSKMGGKMTSGEEDKSWDGNVEMVDDIIDSYDGVNGIIHTQSYSRGKKLSRDLKYNDVFLHKGGDDGDVIENWQDSGEDILISPSIKEGVDLIGGLCRFNILFKSPYPSLGDKRVSSLLDDGEWDWYYSETGKDIVQMYGRSIRSKEDKADFYVIDSSFNDVRKRYDFPDWFREAVGGEKTVRKKSSR